MSSSETKVKTLDDIVNFYSQQSYKIYIAQRVFVYKFSSIIDDAIEFRTDENIGINKKDYPKITDNLRNIFFGDEFSITEKKMKLLMWLVGFTDKIISNYKCNPAYKLFLESSLDQMDMIKKIVEDNAFIDSLFQNVQGLDIHTNSSGLLTTSTDQSWLQISRLVTSAILGRFEATSAEILKLRDRHPFVSQLNNLIQELADGFSQFTKKRYDEFDILNLVPYTEVSYDYRYNVPIFKPDFRFFIQFLISFIIFIEQLVSINLYKQSGGNKKKSYEKRSYKNKKSKRTYRRKICKTQRGG
jgi:hypothetical protein